MRLGVVWVHYHAAELTRRSLELILSDARAGSLDCLPIIVDNGSDEAERRLLKSLPARWIPLEGNPGYAAAVNRGVAECLSQVDALVMMNPDVFVQPGCLATLSEELSRGADVVGPSFFWDEPGGYLLPPTEQCGRGLELLRVLAQARHGRWASIARRSWRRHAQRHWTSGVSIASWDLSGAMLMISKGAWLRAGELDEAFRLYFEETDWLQRCRRFGMTGRFVPKARAVHLYAQSSPKEARAQQWFTESHQRFRQKHYGRSFLKLLSYIARKTSPSTSPELEELDRRQPWRAASQATWVEIAASPIGFPAAGKPISREPEAPLISDQLWAQMAAGSYFVRAVAADGRELGLARVHKL